MKYKFFQSISSFIKKWLYLSRITTHMQSFKNTMKEMSTNGNLFWKIPFSKGIIPFSLNLSLRSNQCQNDKVKSRLLIISIFVNVLLILNQKKVPKALKMALNGEVVSIKDRTVLHTNVFINAVFSEWETSSRKSKKRKLTCQRYKNQLSRKNWMK